MATNVWGMPNTASSLDYEQGITNRSINPITQNLPASSLGGQRLTPILEQLGIAPTANAAASAASGATPLGGPGVTGGTKTAPGMGNVAGGTNPGTGWAGSQAFNPAMLQQIYDSPWLLLPYIFEGMPTGGAGYSALRNMPADPLSLYNMMAGANGMLTGNLDQDGDGVPDGTGNSDYANWLNDLYTNFGSAGGRGFSTQELLRNIFSQDTGAGPGGAKTSLAQILSAGDPSTQSRTLYNLYRDATNAGMNPLAAQGSQAAMMAALDKYGSQSLTAGTATDVPSAVQFVNENMPWLAGLM